MMLPHVRRTRTAMLAALSIPILAAACTGGTDEPTPAEVREDVYVTGAGNNRIRVSGDTAWIVNSFDNTVDEIDLQTCGAAQNSCQRSGQAQLPAGSSPYDLHVEASSLWVTGLLSDELYEVALPGLTVANTLDSSGSIAFSTPLGVIAAGSKVFVANGNGFGSGPGFVTVVEAGALTANVTTTQIYPSQFTVLADGTLAVTNGGRYDFNMGTVTTAGGIDILDPSTASITDNIDLGLTLPGPTALSGDGAHLFVGSGAAGEVLKVEIATGTVQTATLTSAATFISHVLVDGADVYALSFNEDRVYRLDADTLQPVEFTLESGDVPHLSVGPGGNSPKGPIHAVIWDDQGEKHLLVLLTLANSMTDVKL